MKHGKFCQKLREMSTDELLIKERDLREDLFKLKFQHGVRQLDNTARLNVLRRDIARLKSIMREKRAG